MKPCDGCLTITQKDRARFDAKVAEPDANGCHLWMAKTTRGYGIFRLNRRLEYAHRVAFEIHHGPIPEGFEVDHICHVTDCVNPEHLRAVTPKQNAENQAGAQRNSLSGVRGVGWHKGKGKWGARVRHHGKLHHLGYFETIDEAESAAIAGRRALFTHSSECGSR